jgi:hypothetical protein
MIKCLKTLSVILFLTIIVNSQEVSKSTDAKFLAYDKFSVWDNPREPKQILIIEVQKDKLSSVRQIKAIYYPETTGFRGDAKFLQANVLNYKNTWSVKLREPSKDERAYCNIENYLKSSDLGIDSNENDEPTLRFQSTQTGSDVEINDLDKMPCLILEKIFVSNGLGTIQSGTKYKDRSQPVFNAQETYFKIVSFKVDGKEVKDYSVGFAVGDKPIVPSRSGIKIYVPKEVREADNAAIKFQSSIYSFTFAPLGVRGYLDSDEVKVDFAVEVETGSFITDGPFTKDKDKLKAVYKLTTLPRIPLNSRLIADPITFLVKDPF